jgi:hypothetical protein
MQIVLEESKLSVRSLERAVKHTHTHTHTNTNTTVFNHSKRKNWTYFSIPFSPISAYSIAFWKVPLIRLFALLVRAACGWRWVWIIGEIILTGENKIILSKTSHSATSSTTKFIWTSPEWNLGIPPERPSTNCLSHSRPLKTKIDLNYI